MLWILDSHKWRIIDRRDGVVVRASASQSVDLGFIPLVESFPLSEQAGKFACCVIGQGT